MICSTLKEDLKSILHPYYLVNIFLGISFPLFKLVPQLCKVALEGNCKFQPRQAEVLFFLVMIVIVRARKSGSLDLLAYLNNSFIYFKVANSVLWFLEFKFYGIAYVFVFLAQAILLPLPVYTLPHSVYCFRDFKTFRKGIMRDKSIWLVEFFTSSQVHGPDFEQIFAKVFSQFSVEFLNFGRVDLEKFPEIGDQYGLFMEDFSRHLPLLVMFKNGKPCNFRPICDQAGKVVKFDFNAENIIKTFGLDKLYNEMFGSKTFNNKNSQLKSD